MMTRCPSPLSLALAVLCLAPARASAEPLQTAAAGRVVVIDAGHGGTNRGAIGPQGTEEKSITLKLALRTRQILEERSDLRVALTRTGDAHLGLSERSRAANALGAALFVSIHCNSAERPGPRGYESFFLSLDGLADPRHPGVLQGPLDEEVEPVAPAAALVAAITDDLRAQANHLESRRLAVELHDGLAGQLTEALDRGVKQAAFGVLIHSSVPATVVEVGFINHPEEHQLLLDPAYQERIAQGLAAGIERFMAASAPERLVATPGPDAGGA